jgi:RNA polymerase sigma-70 factor (ECF subfamily)
MVDDVFSEAVLVAWTQREKFRKGSNFRAWMYKIVINKLYVANRQVKRAGVPLDDINPLEMVADTDRKEELMEGSEWFFENISDDVYDAFQKLRPIQRSVLLLRAIEKLSYKEIAEAVNVPVGTVMTHLSRGRRKMRDLLGASSRQDWLTQDALAFA